MPAIFTAAGMVLPAVVITDVMILANAIHIIHWVLIAQHMVRIVWLPYSASPIGATPISMNSRFA
jgi:hypothetical protein